MTSTAKNDNVPLSGWRLFESNSRIIGQRRKVLKLNWNSDTLHPKSQVCTSCRVVRSQFWGSGSCHPTTGGCVQWGGVRVSELNFEGRVGPHAAVGRGSHNPPTQASHRVKNPQKRCSSKTIQVIHWTVTSDQESIDEKVENSRQMQWKESLEWKSVLSPFTVPSLSFLGRNHRRKNGT